MAFIALGVTGGIGAYKAVEIARGLQKRDHDVVAIMTRSARRFVGPVTFEAITRRRVITDQFQPGANADIEHIAIASDIALLIVAPATANVIAKFAHGIADDFLTTLYLATRAPVLMAPAMNTNMLEHEAVRRNLAVLADRGVRFVEPGEGFLACGWIGKGRLAEPEDVVKAAQSILDSPGAVPSAQRSLTGRTILVTAGPTYEDVDPVRYIGNRSSGRMGLAVAAEALMRGARVILVTGPVALEPPATADVTRVRSAVQMHQAVMARAAEADAIVMAAAVADYRPAGGRLDQKFTKDTEAVMLHLTRNPDILTELSRWRGDNPRPVLVGFAAETANVVERAREKRLRKGIDIIVANDVSRDDAGFDRETNAATIVSAEADQDVPLVSKSSLAATILDRIERRLGAIDADPSTAAERSARTARER
jgi:phosphopantothenoylcysteine decarboxylase/phosphopantothenate--cysteine ligase